MSPITRSLLEIDLYKLTMQQCMLHELPRNTARYEFACRNTPRLPLSEIAREVNEELDALCDLRFRREELEYLKEVRFLKPDYIEFLRLFQLNREFIQARAVGDQLEIVAEGPQVHVMPFELYVLPIVQGIYQRRVAPPVAMSRMKQQLDGVITRALDRLSRLQDAFPNARPFEFLDFGLRRRFSADWHDEMMTMLRERMPQYLRGTSNVHMARTMSLTPAGTLGHEFLQTMQAMPGVQLRQSIVAANELWNKEYRGDLGIALTDVVTTDAFLRDFDLLAAKCFDGLRQDSGDPLVWAKKVDARYRELRIDPSTKRKVFSDGLSLDTTALDLYEELSCRQGQWTGFGIGTSLSNPSPVGALNIVMKLTTCNGLPTAKISDAPGKTMCRDQGFVTYLKQVFDVKE